jgi:hypothetical protein
MMSRRSVAVLTVIVMGTLQLWDSRVFTAGAPAIAISLTALALPIGTLLFTDRMELRMGAVVLCALLLFAAKVAALHPLPAIGVVAVIAVAANWLAVSKAAPAAR